MSEASNDYNFLRTRTPYRGIAFILPSVFLQNIVILVRGVRAVAPDIQAK